MQYRANYREIDLDALRHNVRQLRKATAKDARLMAVVKSDAYGHGMVQAARAALSAGAEALAVALVEEGETLRQAGVDAPVLVLGATSPREAQGGVALGLTLTVCDPAMVKSVGAACRAQNREASVHLKLDTVMGRICARKAAEVQDDLSALED